MVRCVRYSVLETRSGALLAHPVQMVEWGHIWDGGIVQSPQVEDGPRSKIGLSRASPDGWRDAQTWDRNMQKCRGFMRIRLSLWLTSLRASRGRGLGLGNDTLQANVSDVLPELVDHGLAH